MAKKQTKGKLQLNQTIIIIKKIKQCKKLEFKEKFYQSKSSLQIASNYSCQNIAMSEPSKPISCEITLQTTHIPIPDVA